MPRENHTGRDQAENQRAGKILRHPAQRQEGVKNENRHRY